MFRDTKEELKRLEALLAEEEETEENPEEEEADLPEFEPEAQETGEAGPYRNFANNYRAYNSDQTDVDLEEYSQAVREPKRGGSCLGILVLMLLVGIMAILILFVLKYYGAL